MKARKKSVLEMREAGMTFREIGEKIGVCSGRARDIYMWGTHERNRYCSLSVRASNVLHQWELWPGGVNEPDKKSIREFMEQKGSEVYKYYMVGPVLVKEICDWAGMKMPPRK